LLNKLDIENPECKKHYDAIHPKFAEYFFEAILYFAGKNL
jgi:hypothetical protein